MLEAVVALGLFAHFFFQEKHRKSQEAKQKKLAYAIHIQERTEEAETLDFAVNLFDDETMEEWAFKLERAYSIAEARRAYNNKRVTEEYNRMLKEAEEAKLNKNN